MKNAWVVFVVLGLLYCRAGVCAAGEVRAVCARHQCFQSEVMSTPEGRARGLMSRDRLPDGRGMLFVFDEPGEYPFWMKNMNFPIDIVWLDEAGRVAHMELRVPPCVKDPCPVYAPRAQALYVLEIPSGQAEACGIRAGDRLSWD